MSNAICSSVGDRENVLADYCGDRYVFMRGEGGILKQLMPRLNEIIRAE